MKLALTHRAARSTAQEFYDDLPEIELEDMDWGIKMANWSTRLAHDMVREEVGFEECSQCRSRFK